VDSDSKNFYLGMNYGLRRNYAVSTMDAGHSGESIADGRWAMNNRVAEVAWAYRAVHETARISKLAIEAFYGREPEKSYFNRCSNGGRMAVMEALRYPEDFDGIISGAPAIDYAGLAATFFSWIIRSNMGPDGKDIVSLDDLKLIIDAVYQACDGRPKNSAGDQLYPGGIPLGSEPYWQSWLTGWTDNSNDILIALLSTYFLRYMAFHQDPGDSFNISDFDFDLDPQRLEYMSSTYNSDDPDLELYRKKGGKLLMYHGWADAAVPLWASIEYYEAVEYYVGSREETQSFFVSS
jgi:feruloyl esterase